jgi:EF hand
MSRTRTWIIFAAGFALAATGGLALHFANRPAVATAADAPLAAAAAMPTETPAQAPVSVATAEPSREDKRRGRYDKDKNGSISRDEFLRSRKASFAKLDSNGDGRLDFEEYARKTALRFASADANRDGMLSATEFAATARPAARPKPDCPPEGAPSE